MSPENPALPLDVLVSSSDCSLCTWSGPMVKQDLTKVTVIDTVSIIRQLVKVQTVENLETVYWEA